MYITIFSYSIIFSQRISPYCIHQIASSGYYGFRFVTPPPQCVERFHRYRSNEKNIIASLLKFAGYIHNHKILPGNIFGLILKNQMAATGVFSTLSKDFCGPSRAKGIIGRDLKFAGYVPYYKILTGNIFGLILKNKMATYRKSWAGNLLVWSYLTLDPSFKVKRGKPNLKVLITRLLLVIQVWDGNQHIGNHELGIF